MGSELKTGDKLTTKFGAEVTVRELLGEGGQGYVYKVDYNSGGKSVPKALKWYKMSNMGVTPKNFYDNIVNNIQNKGKLVNESFLWPQDITPWKVDRKGEPEPFGYIMDLRPSNYCEFTRILKGKVKFESYRTVIDVALNIVQAFWRLHVAGYSYQDLNNGNFFVDVKNGKVLICDNDNVAPDKTSTGILGKKRYMAPEIVRGETNPDRVTDYYSMAVVLFMLLLRHHPLEGKRWLQLNLDVPTEKLLYGTRPLFMFDDQDKSNSSFPEIAYVTKRWKEFPEYMRKAFKKAFSRESLLERKNRLSENDWMDVLARFRGDIVSCICKSEIWLREDSHGLCTCLNPQCKKQYKIPLSFNINKKYSLPVYGAVRIYRCQVDPWCTDPNKALDILAQTRSVNGELALVNTGAKAWNLTASSGKTMTVPPGKYIPRLVPGLSFKLDNAVISIEQN